MRKLHAGRRFLRHNAPVYLTITSTATPATDLGYLLHKHPGRAQSIDLPVGRAHVFYPEATSERCTAALLLEVDPIGLVRGKRSTGDSVPLTHYVNDRPYTASSMLAVAVGRMFRTAMAGRCDQRPDLVGADLPLTIRIPCLPTGVRVGIDGGAELVRRLFAPLGWSVTATAMLLDPQLPEWGPSRYVDLQLTGNVQLAQALSHLYVLLPVLDDAKHYWVGDDEVTKLVRAGGSWLGTHPERDLIAKRYLAHQGDLVLSAIGRLAEIDQSTPETLDNAVPSTEERPTSLAAERSSAVLAELLVLGAGRVVDLGCGEGALLRALLRNPSFTDVLGVDVSARALAQAEHRLGLERMPDHQRARLHLLQSSLTYRDDRLAGYDAAVLMEVIEHLDPARLPSMESGIFGHARPGALIVTTPNAEYNVLYPGLAAGGMRHSDHRFEWTRAEFAEWSQAVAARWGYTVRLTGIGVEHPQFGAPTQLAVFSKAALTQPVSSSIEEVG